jgi:hypothetical protein
LSLSTLAAGVGACAAALRPLHALIERHVLPERLQGDDTTVPMLAKGHSVALFYPSRDRTREHPNRHLASCAGILQVDDFDGYSRPLSSRRNSRVSADVT